MMMVILMTLLHFWMACCVTASSSGPKNLNNIEEQFRRNLLANGLGRTPPMGYVLMNFYSLSLNSFSF